METINFWKFFINSNLVLLVSLVLMFIYFTNYNLLKKRGFSEEFIRFKKKDYTKRLIGIMIAVPVLELLAGSITYLFLGELTHTNHLLTAFLIFLVLLIPFPIIDSVKTAKKHEKLMLETKSSVVVDLKHKAFHRIFNPYLETLATTFVIAFYILFSTQTSPLITIHLTIIWLIYIAIRRAKNMNKPLVRETYYFTLLVLTVNHLLVIFHIVYPLFSQAECCPSSLWISSGINLAILLALKIGYYIFQFPLLKEELQ